MVNGKRRTGKKGEEGELLGEQIENCYGQLDQRLKLFEMQTEFGIGNKKPTVYS